MQWGNKHLTVWQGRINLCLQAQVTARDHLYWPASSGQSYALGLVPASRSGGSSQSRRWQLCLPKPDWSPGHQPVWRAGSRSPVHNAIHYFMQWPSQRHSHSPISPHTWKPLQVWRKVRYGGLTLWRLKELKELRQRNFSFDEEDESVQGTKECSRIH